VEHRDLASSVTPPADHRWQASSRRPVPGMTPPPTRPDRSTGTVPSRTGETGSLSTRPVRRRTGTVQILSPQPLIETPARTASSRRSGRASYSAKSPPSSSTRRTCPIKSPGLVRLFADSRANAFCRSATNLR